MLNDGSFTARTVTFSRVLWQIFFIGYIFNYSKSYCKSNLTTKTKCHFVFFWWLTMLALTKYIIATGLGPCFNPVSYSITQCLWFFKPVQKNDSSIIKSHTKCHFSCVSWRMTNVLFSWLNGNTFNISFVSFDEKVLLRCGQLL